MSTTGLNQAHRAVPPAHDQPNQRKRPPPTPNTDTFGTLFGSTNTTRKRSSQHKTKRNIHTSHAEEKRLSVNRNLSEELEVSGEGYSTPQNGEQTRSTTSSPNDDMEESQATKLWKASQKNDEDCFVKNNQWKRLIKYELFPLVKFIHKEEQLIYDSDENSMCQWLLNKMQIIPEQRFKWWEFFKQDINTGLSNRRNNVATRMKDAFMSK